MVVEISEELSVLDEALLEPGAIGRAQVLERLLDCYTFGLAHASRVMLPTTGSK